MGVFGEDSVIKVSTIINLWVSEGFIKPKKETKSLEIVAREYFEELVDRNLVILLPHQETECTNWSFMNRELGWVGMKKLCIMHDLVRDVSIREAQKQRFYYVYSQVHNPSSHLHHHRRIVIPTKTIGDVHRPRTTFESWQNCRSYVCDDDDFKHFRHLRLLRTLHTSCGGSWRDHRYRMKDVFGLVNARLLAIAVQENEYWLPQMVHSSISRLWSLHTLLVLNTADLSGPVELWKMHQLKHVEFTFGRLQLQLPPNNDDDDIVILENLHTLMGMVDFHLNEDVVTRMPNLKILDVHYRGGVGLKREVHCLSYLQRLSKLESFRCSNGGKNGESRKRICFPPSLKQVILLYDDYSDDELAEVLQKLGRLPFLEELLIEKGVFGRGEWETTEGQFPRLRKLELMECHGLKKWIVSEASHFPLLQKVILYKLKELEEIPSEIGEMATLKSVEVRFCSGSAVSSARRMVEEREDLYGEEEVPFRVLVDF